MKIFLSWSGPQSGAIAEAFREWLPLVINAVKPWLSSEIEKGKKWSPEIAESLEATSFGIICLTRSNLTAPWILFEAGALSKKKDAHVFTFLYQLSPADVEQPLGQFQHTVYEETDVLRLVKTINSAVIDAGEDGLPERLLETSFRALWPILKERLDAVARLAKEPQGEVRSDRAILEEILGILRLGERDDPSKPKDVDARLVDFVNIGWMSPIGEVDGFVEALRQHFPNGERIELVSKGVSAPATALILIPLPKPLPEEQVKKLINNAAVAADVLPWEYQIGRMRRSIYSPYGG